MTELLNAAVATQLLKISRSTLYRWTSKRKIPHVKAGGGFFSGHQIWTAGSERKLSSLGRRLML